MPHQFQPKDARIKSEIDLDDDDLTTTLHSQSSRKTRTQELADFLISTGPEEFHKNIPSSASSSGGSSAGGSTISTLSFLKRHRKSKTSSSSSSMSTAALHKQQQQQQQHNAGSPKTLSSAHPKPAKTHIEIAPPPPEPILPRRASSLYSGSMRYRSVSGSTGWGSQRNMSPRSPEQQRHVADVFESRQIDQALEQRMAAANLPPPTPSPTTTTPEMPSTKARHVQIQTDQSALKTSYRPPASQQQNGNAATTAPASVTTVEELQRQIALEKQRQKRLEAAINTTGDQFEVMSGLAYVKLRMLWEEKMHWESAYFALKERCGGDIA